MGLILYKWPLLTGHAFGCLLGGSRFIVCSYVWACARIIGIHWKRAVRVDGCVAVVQSWSCCVSHSLWAESPWPTAICSEAEPLAGLRKSHCLGHWEITWLQNKQSSNGLHMGWYEKNGVNQYDFLSWKFELSVQKECALGVEDTARRWLSHINVCGVASPEHSFVPGSMRAWRLLFPDAYVWWFVSCQLG